MPEERIITQTNIKEWKKTYVGKVRDIYEVKPDEWLIVTTDRLSAFDVVFNEGIPQKGVALNRISNYWFSKIDELPNHLISTTPVKVYPELAAYPGLPERSVLVKKVRRLPIECVVRGYLFGSVYDEYRKCGTAGGNKLPTGIELAGKLPEPIFTPTTKADVGHDENIDFDGCISVVGAENARLMQHYSLEIYKKAAELVEPLGILLADTKFEFGVDENGKMIIVDEVLTPDSSRYWDAKSYQPGSSPLSYDKQFVRDYLNRIGWNKTPPPPALPADIIEKTKDKYLQLLSLIENGKRR